MLDPSTGDPRLAVNLPAWHEGVLEALRSDLHQPVTIENDVNLAAMAERAEGVAQGADDFVLMWIGWAWGWPRSSAAGLHRGVAGAAGEIGYLPVPGVPLPQDVSHPASGAFQSLVGAQAVRPLAESFGFPAPTAAAAVQAAVAAAQAGDERGSGLLDQLAARVATGAAAVSVVLDPGLVVLGGEVGGRAGRRWPTGWPRRWAGSPGPSPGGADRGDRPAGAARRHPGRGGAGPRRAARLRGRALTSVPEAGPLSPSRRLSMTNGPRPGLPGRAPPQRVTGSPATREGGHGSARAILYG